MPQEPEKTQACCAHLNLEARGTDLTFHLRCRDCNKLFDPRDSFNLMLHQIRMLRQGFKALRSDVEMLQLRSHHD